MYYLIIIVFEFNKTNHMTISDIPEEMLREYIASSKTYKEILQKCGYNNCGCSTYLKKRINACNIDVSHIKTKTKVSNDFVRYKLSEILVCVQHTHPWFN